MKTILTTVLLALVVSLSYAGTTSMQEARQNLNEDVKKAFTSEMSKYGNFFYQNNINVLKEKVGIIFRVNDDNTLSLVRVKSNDPDAAEYVKYIFRSQKIKADDLLKGKAFAVNLDLRYSAF